MTAKSSSSELTKITYQAPPSELTLDIRPIRVFPDPFRKGNNVLVLSECYKPEGNGVISPLNHLETEGTCGVNGNNSRYQALQVFNNPKVAEQKPWFDSCLGICAHWL
jgi:glutamine synthetase